MPRRRKRFPPLSDGTESVVAEDLGEPVYRTPVPAARSVITAAPADRVEVADLGEPLTPQQAAAYREQHGIPHPNRTLVPTAAEVAKLPRSARVTFFHRCAARVAPLLGAPTSELDPDAAVRLIVAAATVHTPLVRQLRCVRRDFDRLVYLAKKHAWTDDTPVPFTVFGLLWPGRLTPDWARSGA